MAPANGTSSTLVELMKGAGIVPSSATPSRSPAVAEKHEEHREFVPDYPAGASPFTGLLPTPPRTSSLGSTASAALDAFATETGTGTWPKLPRNRVALRLTQLVRDPSLLNQAGLNACGPAAALYLFARRWPDQFISFVVDLYDKGEAGLGSVKVKGDGLFDKDPLTLGWATGSEPELLDWMILSAVLRSEGGLARFSGLPTDSVSGITWPKDMVTWLKGAGYATVTDNTNLFWTKGLDDLRGLTPGPQRDVVVLVNVDLVLSAASATQTFVKHVASSALRSLPNHWFVLQQPITEAGGRIKATAYTWGHGDYVFDASLDAWKSAYYGAVSAEP